MERKTDSPDRIYLRQFFVGAKRVFACCSESQRRSALRSKFIAERRLTRISRASPKARKILDRRAPSPARQTCRRKFQLGADPSSSRQSAIGAPPGAASNISALAREARGHAVRSRAASKLARLRQSASPVFDRQPRLSVGSSVRATRPAMDLKRERPPLARVRLSTRRRLIAARFTAAVLRLWLVEPPTCVC